MRKTLIIFLLLLSIIIPHSSRAQYNKAYFERKGRNYLLQDNFLEAVKTLNVLLQVDPTAYEGYFLRGIAKYNLHDLLGAESDFSMAVKYNPVFTTAYQYRGITRSRLGNFRDAIDDFSQAIDLRPDISRGYYSRALTFLMNGDARSAINDFDVFLRHENGVSDAYVYRGTAYLIEQDTLSALDNFDTAIKTNKYNPEAYNKRGGVHLAQANYADALADFNEALSHDSTYIASLFNRAIVYANTQEFSRALADFSHVIKLDSVSSIAYFNRALLRAQIGDYNKALEDYDMVTAQLPDNVLVYYNRALLHRKLGDLEAALKNTDRAIELYPDFANAYLLRSELKYLTKDIKGSEKDKALANSKIEQHRHTDSDVDNAIYTDTTYNFQRLLSFDFNVGGSDLFRLRSSGVSVSLLPSFKFSFMNKGEQTQLNLAKYYHDGHDDFIAKVKHPKLTLSSDASNIGVDSLLIMDKAFAEKIIGNNSWQEYFLRGTTQALVRQYTASITSYTEAINKNPANGFLYFNRSTVRSEMIDFISSLEGNIDQITIGADPNSMIKNSLKRQYDYDDAIADLNKAAMLLPDFAYIYYNRANLYAVSGNLVAAYADYTKAIELYPAFAEAYFNRGLVQIYLKDTHKGNLDLSKAAELGVRNAYDVLKIWKKN